MNMILTPLYDNRNSDNGRDQRNRGHQPNRSAKSAGYLQKDCKKNTTTSTSGQKPGASGRLFAITEGQAANTSEVPTIHDQPIVSEFPDVFPDELLGIPSVREVEFNIELISGAEPISKAPYRMAP
nr:putative Gag-Pol polyprotein [Tanacetum cinerariifolium]